MLYESEISVLINRKGILTVVLNKQDHYHRIHFLPSSLAFSSDNP